MSHPAQPSHLETTMFEMIKKIFNFIYYGADDYNKTVRDSEHGRRPISADDV